ncbi:DNA polymerase III subunit epsilon [Plasticicumulans acidivorans]|uniref:DNA polymerase III subunit epsilon n=1 Tax=Plasticicumulans acidivorans TaxID=886464 RepID=A0A317MY84_9GAMM|nr:DNA polymerase III subunit epsilon [Plasticicumulans acidivorans]PWV60481.1 DNA polymerase-3 subunit epsilon [Plasticicumulans acidivorans]
MRQVVLDTETTGLDPALGHRIIEIGCVEIDGRRPTGRTFHCYINPQRGVDAGAVEVHGLTNAFLADKPVFADIAQGFLHFIDDAQLIIHNAAFDIGFINHEFSRLPFSERNIADSWNVLDTLQLARDKHPGQRNTLDALCRRYGVDNSKRNLHGALLDARILADVYLAMTGGQVAMTLEVEQVSEVTAQVVQVEMTEFVLPADRPALRVVAADEGSLIAHEAMLDMVERSVRSNSCFWRGRRAVEG